MGYTLVDDSNQFRGSAVAKADNQKARALVDLLEEVVSTFGAQGSEEYCCEDVSYVEYRALRVLSKIPFCTMQDLGQQLGFTKSGATRITDRLEIKGYVRRERSEDDHRICCVTLTEKGCSLVERVVDDLALRTGTSLERLDEEMRDILLASLRRFVRTFHEV